MTFGLWLTVIWNFFFASKEERDEFMDDNGLIPESWPGTWEYDIECDIHRGTYDTIGGYYDKNTVRVI